MSNPTQLGIGGSLRDHFGTMVKPSFRRSITSECFESLHLLLEKDYTIVISWMTREKKGLWKFNWQLCQLFLSRDILFDKLFT